MLELLLCSLLTILPDCFLLRAVEPENWLPLLDVIREANVRLGDAAVSLEHDEHRPVMR